MTILSQSLALAAAFTASAALAQTPPQAPSPTSPAKPGAAPLAGQTCPHGWMMAQGRMMNGQPGPHMGRGPGGQGVKPGAMMPNGMMMGRGGAYCYRQGAAPPDAKAVPAPPAK